MMSMLGLRGSGGSSRQKGEEAQGKSSKAAAAAAASSSPVSAKALRLVYCDERGKFRMDPEAVTALQLVKAPLGVVSVCGRSRQGKSFILNQLLGRSNGFQVASTHRPCTKGLWMWSTPLNRIAPDGTEYNLLLLDSEGIDAYDQTGTYSIQIFSLAVLLSSMFVYNQMGGIDEAALDRLSLVTEMTKHVRVRAQSHSSAVELGQFSPIFVWLLRDFYFDLTEDGRRITPKEYLESALQPMAGTGKAVVAKNQIRDSIRALFPDRHCFALVRPLNDERDLQRLDQIPVERMRPEFRAGLDSLTRFVFERARPKQMGSTVMTGPLLAGLTQSFLEALNAGAVPTIATSWQSVEESECRRAHECAIEVYVKAFNKSTPEDENQLEDAHEAALQEALAAYNNEAVGAGAARHKHEKLLTSSLKKRFEDYKSRVSMEFELKCVKALENMDEKLRAACHSPAATLDQVLPVLNGLVADYERSTAGPTKWKRLVKFLQQSLEGPLLDLTKKWTDQISGENANFKLKCRSLEDRLVLLGKQLDSSQREAQDWKRRYEAAAVDYKSSSEEHGIRYNDLQKSYSSLEERFVNLSRQLEIAQKEASEWRNKHESLILEQRIEKERITSELATLQSRCSAAEARLAAAREQTAAAKEEAVEWRRKHDAALKESHAAVEKSTSMHEQAKRQAQAREDALRADMSSAIERKEIELKDVHKRLQQHEHRMAELNAQVKEKELKLKQQEEEVKTLRSELKQLQTITDNAKLSSQAVTRELEIVKQEKCYAEERLKMELKRREEAEEKCKVAEKEVNRASEVADSARAETSIVEKEKLEVQQLAAERLATIERMERHVETLTKEKWELAEDIERIRLSEQEAVSRMASLERRLEEREKEMEELLHSEHEQRANTVHVLESLLATERQAHTEANTRAEALSLQLQATQGKFDALQQELSTMRLNETALDAKLKAKEVETGGARNKRLMVNDGHVESVQNMELDSDMSGSRKKKARIFGVENGSPSYSLSERETPTRVEDGNASNDLKDFEEYLKFTVSKLKQELTKAGFGAELLQLRNPSKKDILGLYEKLVLQK